MGDQMRANSSRAKVLMHLEVGQQRDTGQVPANFRLLGRVPPHVDVPDHTFTDPGDQQYSLVLLLADHPILEVGVLTHLLDEELDVIPVQVSSLNSRLMKGWHDVGSPCDLPVSVSAQ